MMVMLVDDFTINVLGNAAQQDRKYFISEPDPIFPHLLCLPLDYRPQVMGPVCDPGDIS